MKNKRLNTLLVTILLACMLSGCAFNNVEDGYINKGDYSSNPSDELFIKEEIVRDAPIEEYYTHNGSLNISDNYSLYENWDYEDIQTMYLTVRQGAESDGANHTWSEVNTYSAYYYDELGIDRYKVDALLQVGDEHGPVEGELGYGEYVPNATVSVRGQTSTRYDQKNYRISLKDGKGEWNDMSVINLNKHMGDGIRCTNMLMYYWMHQIDGMMADRTKFVHLYVKDETDPKGDGVFKDYGLYTFVEQINKRYLKNHGLDKEGQLYKVNFFEFYEYPDVILPKNDSRYNVTEFEKYLEIKGNDDHTKLIQMLKELNDYSIPIEETFNKWFDEENYFTYMAFQILVGNKDTQSRNQFLYSPSNVNKFYFISWDNDASMQETTYELLNYSEGGGFEEGISNYWGNVLHKRVFQTKEYRDKLDVKINELREFLNEERVMQDVKKFSDIVKPYVYSMPDVQYARVKSEQFDYVVEHYWDAMEQNYNRYLDSYQKPMPFFIGEPVDNGETISINWEGAFDFDFENITYSYALDDDYMFESPIIEDTSILPNAEFAKLNQGHYFFRVYATNTSGYTQSAFDYYVSDRGKEYGMISFWIDADGNIYFDEYEE